MPLRDMDEQVSKGVLLTALVTTRKGGSFTGQESLWTVDKIQNKIQTLVEETRRAVDAH